ncbi:MAG: response regulator transcription factor [Kosmotogaceae bacterium]
MKILVVDDDQDILEIVEIVCKEERLDISTAQNAKQMYEKLNRDNFDLIVLDIMLPDGNGLDLIKSLKAQYGDIPVVFLTARKSDIDMILGLELGADDYITKPFSPRALIAKIKAVLRRVNKNNSDTENEIRLGNLIIDINAYRIFKEGKQIELTRREVELLKLFLKNPERVFNRNTLLDKAWGEDFFGDHRTIDVHISKLREKIGKNYIKTVRGIGYKFTTEIEEDYDEYKNN